MEQLLSDAQTYINHVCQLFAVDETHALNHAINVMEHLKKAITNDTIYHLNSQTQTDLLLTGLLHDLDDHKYFPQNSQNASDFLKQYVIPERTQNILRWISYVSTSKNGNSIPTEAIEHPWVLWPRYCDRIEAVGIVGVQRVFEYSHSRGIPDRVADTPRATTYEEVMSYVTPERLRKYIENNGVSASTIDHIYDKLLHICDVETHSPYINQQLSTGKQALVNVCLGRTPPRSPPRKEIGVKGMSP